MSSLAPALARHLRKGVVIPAHPLALTADNQMDERYQKALTRYYMAAGAGGIAVGVHTTQFEIHEPERGLLAPVLELASETADQTLADAPRPFIKIAGLLGDTDQATREAEIALAYGYHAGLLSLSALKHASDQELIEHCRRVADVIPVFGFYLQPAVGGRVLSYQFWREFAEIPNVVGIKIAPFNRYQTLDVMRAVHASGRAGDIALYTGNDDNIVADLLTEYRFDEEAPPVSIVGGLLGQWAVWTKCAVDMLAAIQSARAAHTLDHKQWLAYGAQLTDANAVIFDAAHGFRGCLPGIHLVLQRQGLMPHTHTLNPNEQLSPQQPEELDRIYRSYPHLNDDAFIAEHRDEWLR